MRIVFKNLEPSQLAREIAADQILLVLEKFPKAAAHRATLTLSMDNSSRQPGKDLFGARLMLSGKNFSNLLVEKKATSLYQAVGNLREALLEVLNRTGDRQRVSGRTKQRQLKLAKLEIV
jgi:hypothetical protein